MAKVKTAKPSEAITGTLMQRLREKHKCLIPLGEIDLNVRKVPTGIWTLDETLNGGIPVAKITEIHGAGGAGKTSLACLIGAAFQKAYPNKGVIYIDTESALDDNLAMTIYGLDRTRTLLVRPDADFAAEELMDTLLGGAFDPECSLVILDSVAGLVTHAENDRTAGEVLVAPIATLLGRTLKKLNQRPDPDAATILLLNQQRHAIGNAGITCPGGSAVEFYPSLRLRLRKGDPVKDGDQEIGFTCRATVTKARYSRQRVVTGWSVIYGEEGISTLRAIITVALQQKLIKQAGSWFSIEGLEGAKWQGMEKMLDAIRADESLLSFVRDNLRVEYTTE